MHSWKAGLALGEPASSKRRRRALAAEETAGRRERSVTAERGQTDWWARMAAAPLAAGPALIVIMALSVGLWAIVWAAIALAVSAEG